MSKGKGGGDFSPFSFHSFLQQSQVLSSSVGTIGDPHVFEPEHPEQLQPQLLFPLRWLFHSTNTAPAAKAMTIANTIRSPELILPPLSCVMVSADL